MNEKEMECFNKVYDWTFNKFDKKCLPKIIELRNKMKSGQRFVIDKNFLDFSLRLDPSLKFLSLARLPYPVTWLEIDLPEMKIGHLLTELNPDTGEWLCNFFIDGKPTYHSVKMNPEAPYDGDEVWTTMAKHMANDQPYITHTLPIKNFLGLNEPKEPLGVEYQDMLLALKNTFHIVIILALLAEAPNIKESVKPKEGFRYKGMYKLPYFSHSIIRLKLPKKKPVRYVMRLIDKASDNARKLRAHTVRGHFRQIERGKPLPYPCKHEPVMVENGLGMCKKCERMIRWVPSHTRGDSSIGWVYHDYRIESS